MLYVVGSCDQSTEQEVRGGGRGRELDIVQYKIILQHIKCTIFTVQYTKVILYVTQPLLDMTLHFPPPQPQPPPPLKF